MKFQIISSATTFPDKNLNLRMRLQLHDKHNWSEHRDMKHKVQPRCPKTTHFCSGASDCLPPFKERCDKNACVDFVYSPTRASS